MRVRIGTRTMSLSRCLVLFVPTCHIPNSVPNWLWQTHPQIKKKSQRNTYTHHRLQIVRIRNELICVKAHIDNQRQQEQNSQVESSYKSDQYRQLGLRSAEFTGTALRAKHGGAWIDVQARTELYVISRAAAAAKQVLAGREPFAVVTKTHNDTS